MKTYKRRNYFIDHRYQTKYIILTVLLLLGYTMVLMCIVFVPYILDLASDGPMAQQVEAARTLLDLHGRIWPGVFVVIILFGGLSVFVSHQVAGPVYRLKKGLQQISEGDLTGRIHLRRRDDLKDLADSTNLLCDELRRFLAALHDNQEMLFDYLRELQSEVEKKAITPEDGERIIARVQAGIDRNREIMEKFRV